MSLCCSIDELLQDSDSELGEDPKESGNKNSGRKQKSTGGLPAWLRDDSDDITDFLDSKAAKNIVGVCLDLDVVLAFHPERMVCLAYQFF